MIRISYYDVIRLPSMIRIILSKKSMIRIIFVSLSWCLWLYFINSNWLFIKTIDQSIPSRCSPIISTIIINATQ